MPTAAKIQWPEGQPLFETQWRAVAESLAGNGVRSATDLEVTATATDLEIQVATGTAYYVGSEYTLGTAETHLLSGGDATDDRWDTVYFDTATSSSGVREGTPAASPEPPDVQGDELLLAVVYVPAGATDVPDADVLNWRAQFSNEAEEIHYDDSTGQYSVNSVDAALDELQEAAQIGSYPLGIGDLASPFAPTDIASVNGYPFPNSDLSNSTTTVNAGTGLATTNASISLGGSATLSIDVVTSSEVDSSVDLDFVRGHDNTIGGTLASLGTNPGTFGAVVNATVDGNSTQGTVHSYGLALDATTLLTLTVESDGAGSVQNARIPLSAPLNLLAQSAAPGWSGQGAGYYDTDDETPKFAESGGAYQRPLSRPNVDEFSADESGSVASGNSGVVFLTQVPDGGTFEVVQAGLLLADGQPAPTGLDLAIATLDNAGAATRETVVITGDGAVQNDLTGSPLASYANTSGGEQTVGLLVDNGNFNSGTGSSQDIVANARGEVV